MKKISILGMGRWASCIAYLLNKQGYKVQMWERGTNGGSELFKTHSNQYLTLPKSVKFTHNLEEALNNPDLVIISILSQNLKDLCSNISKVEGFGNHNYCIAMKGIDASSGKRLSQVLASAGVNKNNIAVWVGPGHVQTLSNNGATNMVISAYDMNLAENIASSFSSKNLHLSTIKDIVGAELCAAYKNVYGIAAGIMHSNPNYSHSLGSLMVASVEEMGKFVKAMGGEQSTARGLALLGDYQATLFDEFSKNLTYGKAIVELNTLDENVLSKKVKVSSVEGIGTAHSLAQTIKNKNVEMPIASKVDDIISGKVELKKAADELFKTVSAVLENCKTNKTKMLSNA